VDSAPIDVLFLLSSVPFPAMVLAYMLSQSGFRKVLRFLVRFDDISPGVSATISNTWKSLGFAVTVVGTLLGYLTQTAYSFKVPTPSLLGLLAPYVAWLVIFSVSLAVISSAGSRVGYYFVSDFLATWVFIGSSLLLVVILGLVLPNLGALTVGPAIFAVLIYVAFLLFQLRDSGKVYRDLCTQWGEKPGEAGNEHSSVPQRALY
jgi:hypothetical protein